jgi:hypothetical protein
MRTLPAIEREEARGAMLQCGRFVDYADRRTSPSVPAAGNDAIIWS